MYSQEKSNSKRIAYTGILTALAWLMIIVSSYLPTGRFFILTLSSLCLVIVWLDWGKIPAFLVYLAVALLSLIWPGFISSLSFLFFFGLYPLLYFLLLKKTNRPLAFFLLHLVMTLLIFALLAIFGIEYFISNIWGLEMVLFWFILFVALQLILLAYAYLLSRFTELWLTRIKKNY